MAYSRISLLMFHGSFKKERKRKEKLEERQKDRKEGGKVVLQPKSCNEIFHLLFSPLSSKLTDFEVQG